MQTILDKEFKFVLFNKTKVRGYSQIEAKFAIKGEKSDDIYLCSLTRKQTGIIAKSQETF